MKLFYLPLEPYKERYTWFMSCKGGWAESNFRKYGIDFMRVEGEKDRNEIKAGVVLDAYGRSIYAMTQIEKVIFLLETGYITDEDVIYTEDFWQPGVESLFYIRDITGIRFKVGCFLHAQSVDEWDFTFPMRYWIRDVERGLSRGYDFIFVTSAILKDKCISAGYNSKNIYCIGLPYNSKKLLEQIKEMGFKWQQKEPFVLFSSRFDKEKNPHFFLDLVERCPDINFKLVNPRNCISNDSGVIERLRKMQGKIKNLEIVDTKNKLDYYTLLCKAEIQFNCAYQDWVSWTLLEALTFNCKVLYPMWRDFPNELKNDPRYLYIQNDIDDAERKLKDLFEQKDVDFKLKDEVIRKHDNSWKTYLKTMGFEL